MRTYADQQISDDTKLVDEPFYDQDLGHTSSTNRNQVNININVKPKMESKKGTGRQEPHYTSIFQTEIELSDRNSPVPGYRSRQPVRQSQEATMNAPLAEARINYNATPQQSKPARRRVQPPRVTRDPALV